MSEAVADRLVEADPLRSAQEMVAWYESYFLGETTEIGYMPPLAEERIASVTGLIDPKQSIPTVTEALWKLVGDAQSDAAHYICGYPDDALSFFASPDLAANLQLLERGLAAKKIIGAETVGDHEASDLSSGLGTTAAETTAKVLPMEPARRRLAQAATSSYTSSVTAAETLGLDTSGHTAPETVPEDEIELEIDPAEGDPSNPSATTASAGRAGQSLGNVETGMVVDKPPGFRQLRAAFQGVLEEHDIEKLQVFTPTQREAFLYFLRDIYIENSQRKQSASVQMQRIDHFMQGLSVYKTAIVMGHGTDSVYQGIRTLPQIFMQTPDTIKSLVDNIDDVVGRYADVAPGRQEVAPKRPSDIKPELPFDMNEFTALLYGVLDRKHVNIPEVKLLAQHMTGTKSEDNFSDSVMAAIAMREVIGTAIQKLRRYRPDATTGLMTRDDAWLFSKLLGDPQRNIWPASLREVYVSEELRQHFQAPNLRALQRESVAAVARLHKTLII